MKTTIPTIPALTFNGRIMKPLAAITLIVRELRDMIVLTQNQTPGCHMMYPCMSASRSSVLNAPPQRSVSGPQRSTAPHETTACRPPERVSGRTCRNEAKQGTKRSKERSRKHDRSLDRNEAGAHGGNKAGFLFAKQAHGPDPFTHSPGSRWCAVHWPQNNS